MKANIHCGIFPSAMIDTVLNYSIKWTDAFSLRKEALMVGEFSMLFLDLALYLCVPLQKSMSLLILHFHLYDQKSDRKIERNKNLPKSF